MTNKTKGGALNIKEEHVTDNLSDSELHSRDSSASPETNRPPRDAGVEVVEKFDPPKHDDRDHVFQNGDTNRDGN